MSLASDDPPLTASEMTAILRDLLREQPRKPFVPPPACTYCGSDERCVHDDEADGGMTYE